LRKHQVKRKKIREKNITITNLQKITERRSEVKNIDTTIPPNTIRVYLPVVIKKEEENDKTNLQKITERRSEVKNIDTTIPPNTRRV
jgi:hypothetical protein